MAIGSLIKSNVRSSGLQNVVVAAPKGQWVTVNDDARTAQGASVLLSPATVTDSVFHWVAVPEGVRKVLVRARMPVGTATVTTSPKVRVWGAFKTQATSGEVAIGSDGSFVNDGTIQFVRLDNATVSNAGVTLSLATSSRLVDSTWSYSDVSTLSGYDTQGADYIGVMVDTAAAIVSSAAVEIQVLLLN
jgi:hypothetical protein